MSLRRAPPLCKDCAHFEAGSPSASIPDRCNHQAMSRREVVRGEIVLADCRTARAFGRCGPAGKLFERRGR